MAKCALILASDYTEVRSVQQLVRCVENTLFYSLDANLKKHLYAVQLTIGH